MGRERPIRKIFHGRKKVFYGRKICPEDWNGEISVIIEALAGFSLEKPRILDCHPCEEGLEVTVEVKLPKDEFEGEGDA